MKKSYIIIAVVVVIMLAAIGVYAIINNNSQNKKQSEGNSINIEDTTNKINYVIYTDDETNKKGETICYASTYVRSSKGNMTKLKPVIMKEEFDFIEKILSSLEEKE